MHIAYSIYLSAEHGTCNSATAMASSLFFIIAILLLSISNKAAIAAANPKSFFIPAFKDTVKTQYYIKPQLGTPAATFFTSIDLSGQNLITNCDIYKSSSQSRVQCNTTECNAVGSGSCFACRRAEGCNTTVDYNNCGCYAYNPFKAYYDSDILKDVIALGALPSPVRLPGFLFACLLTPDMIGLLASAQGLVGLGSAPMGLVAQLASAFKVDRTVSVCLPSSVNEKAAGAVVIGSLASAVKPISLTRTPLIPYPVENAVPAQEYFIGVKSVRISGQAVALNSSLLSLDKDGAGGTKVSTIHPWTVLKQELYGPIVVGFARKALSMKLKRVAGVRPFGACYSTASAAKTATGPAVPTIELDLDGGGQWKIYGANSMVNVNNEVMCLGIVKSMRASGPAILIGGHMLEDNLIELDQRGKTLRFSSSLLAQGLSCSSLPRV